VTLKTSESARENYAEQLRKQQKEDRLQNKRKKLLESDAVTSSATVLNSSCDPYLVKHNPIFATSGISYVSNPILRGQEEQIMAIASEMCVPVCDNTLLVCYARLIRQALASTHNPPIDLVVKLELLPKLADLLILPLESVQLDIAWALTNIAAHKSLYCDIIRALGCHRQLVSLVSNERLGLTEQVRRFCYGSVYGPSVTLRPMVSQLEMTSSRPI
jgi:hypothetical protein